MKTIRKAVLTLASLTALTLSSTQAAVVYDLQNTLAAAQPTVPNPTGNFSFGKYSDGTITPSMFVLYTTFTEDLAGSGLDGFYTNPFDPNVLYNDTGSPFTGFNMTLQAGAVGLGPVSGPSVIRFTAPTTGYYDISADFSRIQVLNAAAYTYVYLNTTQLSSSTQDTHSFSNTGNLLNAGDTIDFIVGGPSSGESTTSLSATVTFTAVPEPSTISALGLCAVMTFARRTSRKNRIS